MKRSKLLSILMPTTIVASVFTTIPLASCSNSTGHVKLSDLSSAHQTLDANNQVKFYLVLDRNDYKNVKVSLAKQVDGFRIETSQSNEIIIVTLKYLSRVNEDTTFDIKLNVSCSEWTDNVSGLSIFVKSTAEQKTVDEINTALTELEQEGIKPSTMSGLIGLLYLKAGIDLESLTTTNDSQWVWDCDANKVFVLNDNGTVKVCPKCYSLSKYKVNIWKMVGGNQTFKLHASLNESIKIDPFDSTSQYSQYLRSDATFDKTEPLQFCSGLDTGNHTGFELVFNKDETLTEEQPKAIINTNKSSLVVTSDLNDIEHHGNLTTLTINELPDKGVYTEFGTVDARVVLNDGAIVAEAGSSINDVVITSDDVVGVQVKADSVVGTVVVTTDVSKNAEDFVDDDEATTPVDTSQKKQDPDPETRYAGGFGTKNSPYAISSLTQLIYCRDDVNSATLSETNTLHFILINDIDIQSVDNWTPIGTKEKQFFGTFDGNGYTITNLKISADCPIDSGKYGWGLFGYTNGKHNDDYDKVEDIWQDKQLVWDNITEDKYTTVIKNVTLDNVNIQITGDDARCVGGLIGASQNTFVSGCQVKSGSISGCKGVGGLIGTIAGSICYDCMAGANDEEASPLEVTASVYNIGGLIGCGDYKITIPTYTYNAIIASSTGSNCMVTANDNVGGYIGGILSYCDYCHGIVIDGCVNNATVESINTSTDNEGIAGIVAFGYGRSGDKIANCINNGSIIVSGNSKVGNAAGIIIEPAYNELVYNCTNYGTITANATNGVAGVAAGCEKSGDSPVLIDSCANEGEITNTLNPSKASDICDSIKKIKLVGMTFENVQELNKTISRAGDAQTEITFENCEVTDKTGSIVLPTSVSSITSDKPLSENISVSGMTSLTVNIPDQNITVTQDSDCNIISFAQNNTITIESNGAIKSVAVCGEGSTVLNNGTVKRTIALDEASKSATNNGTCANVRFGKYEDSYKHIATNEKTFINNGTITGLADSTETNNNVISVHTLNSRPDITLKNYGTIKYQNNGLSTPADLIHYDADGDFILECYENSKIITDKQNFFNTTSSLANCYAWLKWKEGYSVEEIGTNKTFDEIKTQYVGAGTKVHITVQELQ